MVNNHSELENANHLWAPSLLAVFKADACMLASCGRISGILITAK